MLKKFALSFCVISCFSYAMQQPAVSTSAAAVPPTVLPDISPKAFGVSGGEPYIRALRDFAQVLFMQHRYFKTILDQAVTEEMVQKQEQLKFQLEINAWNRIAWLEQTPEACFVSSAEADFFKTLQEIKQAIRSGQDHELIVRGPGGIPIFAATLQGVELLLNHRSLFMQDSIDSEHKPLIDNIYQETKHSENMEVVLLATLLKLKLEQSIGQSIILKNAAQRHVCKNDVVGSMTLIEQNYKLSPDLHKCFVALTGIMDHFHQKMLSPSVRIPGNPATFKQQAIIEYNGTQPAIYAIIRKKLLDQVKKMERTNKGFCVYSRTVQGEPLPLRLDPIDVNPVQEEVQVPAAVSQPVPSEAVQAPRIGRKSGKKTYKQGKQPKKKNKQNKAASDSLASPDCSQIEQELAVQQTPSTSSAPQPVQAVAPLAQEEAPEGNPSTSSIEQGGAPSVTTVECAAEVSAAPSTPVIRECQEEEAKTTVKAAAAGSCPRHEETLVIGISGYNDGKVLSSEAGSMVVIDDPCNKMCLHLYQTDKKCMRYNYTPVYKQHILRWFQSAKEALSKKHVSTMPEQNSALRRHRFSRNVDQYIPTMGVTRTVPSRKPGHGPEREFVIPGYVEFYESRKPMYCLFSYIVDSANDKCFHRNMELRGVLKAFSDFYKNGFFEVERPPLECQKH